MGYCALIMASNSLLCLSNKRIHPPFLSNVFNLYLFAFRLLEEKTIHFEVRIQRDVVNAPTLMEEPGPTLVEEPERKMRPITRSVSSMKTPSLPENGQSRKRGRDPVLAVSPAATKGYGKETSRKRAQIAAPDRAPALLAVPGQAGRPKKRVRTGDPPSMAKTPSPKAPLARTKTSSDEALDPMSLCSPSVMELEPMSLEEQEPPIPAATSSCFGTMSGNGASGSKAPRVLSRLEKRWLELKAEDVQPIKQVCSFSYLCCFIFCGIIARSGGVM